MHGCCLRGAPLWLDRSREVRLALAMRTLVPSPKPQGADTVSPGGSPVTESTFEQARRTALDADGSEESQVRRHTQTGQRPQPRCSGGAARTGLKARRT